MKKSVVLTLCLVLIVKIPEASSDISDPTGQVSRTPAKPIGKYSPQKVIGWVSQPTTYGTLPIAEEFRQGMIQATWSSWYGPGFQGRKTASGEIFNMYDISTAHPSLPLGTTLRIRNPANDRLIEAKVTDRGPYFEGRGLDLSYGAALELGIVEEGVAWLEYKIIKLPK